LVEPLLALLNAILPEIAGLIEAVYGPEADILRPARRQGGRCAARRRTKYAALSARGPIM
jgi:hypothetical protein